ncbi:MAG: EF-Tu/IF-2/RF-3 family GTPase [Gammaproteobacteria bacterium]|nr:EF-Tu/IF-2/RF-3 family GTPase [Gammaproteobacteria bacterium]
MGLGEAISALLSRGSARKKQQPSATYDSSSFCMTVEDCVVIELENRGTVATGTIESGTVRAGDELELVSTDQSKQVVKVAGIEMFLKDTNVATKGETAGLLLAGIGKGIVSPGDILQSP